MAVPEFVRRGRELTRRGLHLEAVKVCRLGLLAHPSELEGRLTLGAALLALGRYDEVLAEMRVALEIDGLNATALALKGEALLCRGDGRGALDVLAQAERASPGDPRVAALIERARAAAAEGGTSVEDLVDDTAWTRNYPSHLGRFDSALEQPERSDRATRPGGRPPGGDTEIEPPGGEFAADAAPTTIEIDPELEGFEVAEARPDDSGETELGSSDLIPAFSGSTVLPGASDEVRGFDSSYRPGADEPTHGYKGRDSDEAVTRTRDAVDVEAPLFLDLEPERPKRAGFPTDKPRRSRPPPPPRAPAGGDAVAALFPEDEDGVSKIELVDEETGLPRSLARVPREERPPPPRVIEAGRSGPAAPAPRGSSDDDMRTIRAGLGMRPDPSESSARDAPPPQPKRPAPPTGLVRRYEPAPASARRRRLSIPLLVALAVLLVGGGVAGGVALRKWRTEQQLGAAAERARQLVASGNYRDYLRAAALLDRALEISGAPDLVAQRARLEVALADEFGARGGAAELVEAVADSDSLDAQVARARLALSAGDAAGARELAEVIAKRAPSDPIGHYLRGRAEAELGQLDAARTSLEAARERGASPLVIARLSEVYRLSGELESAAAITGEGTLPALAIARARAIAAAGKLASADEPEGTLEAIVADRERPPRKQELGVSPRQGSLATLALAEVALARGDRDTARQRLAALSGKDAPADAPFLAAYVQALLAVGDVAAAAAKHRELAAAWPKSARTHLLGARLALRSGDLVGAQRAIAAIENLDTIPEALALRGELALADGRLEEAAADLDKALAASPELASAVIARSRVDVARGEPDKALERLEKVPRSRSRDLARARAMGAAGQTEEARSLLESLAEGDRVDALLEIARLEEAANRRKQAMAAYDRVLAISEDNLAARLGRAELRLESGQLAEARKTLEALAEAHPKNPRALLAAARARTLGGDPGGAGALLDAAAEQPGAPRWQLERERGRSLLRQRRFADAVTALDRAAELRANDVETWLLILEAHLRRGDPAAGREAVKKASGPLSGSHVLALLRGMEALLAADGKQAVESFQTARRLVPEGASERERARFAYWLGRGYEAAGDFDRARAVLSQAIRLDPSHADAHLSLGDVEVQERNVSEAIKSYRRSASLDPVANPRVFFSLGELYTGERRFEQAREALEQYLELEPDGDLAGTARELLAEIK